MEERDVQSKKITANCEGRHRPYAIHTTRRDFFVFKSKQNRLWKKILQDMHTKWFKLLICFQRFGKSEKIWKLNDFENSIIIIRVALPSRVRSVWALN